MLNTKGAPFMASITESAHWRARYGVSPYTSAAYKTVEDRRREDKAWLGDAGRRTYDEGTCGWMVRRNELSGLMPPLSAILSGS